MIYVKWISVFQSPATNKHHILTEFQVTKVIYVHEYHYFQLKPRVKPISSKKGRQLCRFNLETPLEKVYTLYTNSKCNKNPNKLKVLKSLAAKRLTVSANNLSHSSWNNPFFRLLLSLLLLHNSIYLAHALQFKFIINFS